MENQAVSSKAYPLADTELTARVLKVCNEASNYDQIKKGINETLKALHKSIADIVVLAADATPIDILLPVPPLCEMKNVLYIFVPLKTMLGRACGVNRPIACAVITHRENSALEPQVVELRNKIEQVFI
eukprot:Gregarina_sp_Pseudo_9__2679@NODE_2926_length_819_cov_9_834615_g2672_i0_p1_GENE_NODE_2926_length_819_cov_9_834615_g2672_i0NODE_2926_length_819_cov_9_834615_g2672_i0_p1_ORF_typecomplete_len129_score9_84Ribosomal_L7Ae/PF01248_26/9_3e22DUF1024/PF06260_12/0_075DUF1024/PF06260_12/3_1e03_NODE_2926_length_819_cov_9_834615_g2672_i0103489